MKFAVVGCGVIGRIHAHVIKELTGATLAAMVDNDLEKAKQTAAEFGCKGMGLQEMLHDPDIDAISVCVPSGLHSTIGVAGAQAGKHVLLEKPIDVSLEAADRTIEACAKHNVKLGVIFQRRFEPDVQTLKKSITQGDLGAIHFANSRTCWYRDADYFKGSWRGTLKMDGGGALINQSVHYIDLLQYMVGEVDSVCGKVDTLLHRSIEGEDLGCAMLRFKNGAIGTIEGTTLAFGDCTTELNVFGEQGSVRIKNDKTSFFAFQGETPAYYQSSEEEREELIREKVNIIPHKLQYEDFCMAVQQNRAPLVDGLEGRKALAIIQAIYHSSKINDWVSLASFS